MYMQECYRLFNADSFLKTFALDTQRAVLGDSFALSNFNVEVAIFQLDTTVILYLTPDFHLACDRKRKK